MFWTFILFIITLSILILFHEFGHYTMARLCGVQVERFSLGFGPKIASGYSRSGTEFQLAAIPLGGYIKMLDSRVDKLNTQDEMFAFDRQSKAKRAAIIFAGPAANFILAFLLYWIVFQLGVFTFPVTVEGTAPGTVASSLHIPKNSELKSVNGIQVESWQDVRLALIGSLGKDKIKLDTIAPKQKQITTHIAYLSQWKTDLSKEDPVKTFGLIPKTPEILPVLAQVIPHSAADRAGLKAGDRITKVNNVPFLSWDKFTNKIKEGRPVYLEIERQGQISSIHLIPEIRRTGKQQKGFAGLVPQTNLIKKSYSPFDSVGKAAKETRFMILVTVRSFYQLATGALSLKNLSGPVTIAKSADQSASYGIVAYLYFLAFINISLGVVNLLPLPILDGGHLAFLLVEFVIRRPVCGQKVVWAYKLSFILLIVLMGIALFNDFSRLSF